MATFLIIIIYLAFISLGLPDSLLGVAWPAMHIDFRMPLEAAGLVSMIIAGGTILSSLASGKVIKRLGTGKVTFISCLMTAVSLLGFSLSPSFIWLLFLAIPLGLGAGSVDAALNNYVATHYKAHHMSWLHCFWGLGATLGPVIMSRFISSHNSWRSGYFTVSMLQFSLAIILFFSLPLWVHEARKVSEAQKDMKKNENIPEITSSSDTSDNNKPLKIKGVKIALVSFLFYCGAESTMGLWGSSFLVNIKHLPVAKAAALASLYYGGITVGRFITGFITLRVRNSVLIRIGQLLALSGALLLLLPLPAICCLLGIIMFGLGCAPIFPCMLHETPVRFGKEHSQTIIGYQMAIAYTGSTFFPPILGLIASHTTIGVLPLFLIVYIIIMLTSSEKTNILMKTRKAYASIY